MPALTSSLVNRQAALKHVGYLLAALGACFLPAVAHAEEPNAKTEDLIVKYDQSKILRLTRPASEIIIGNPSIADVTIQSGNMLVITGKSYGITNIIALDGERNVIQDQRISVRRDEVGVVNLMRGTARQTYACLPQCNPTVTLGDDVTFLAQTIDSARQKMSFSEGHSNEKGTPGQNN